MSGTFYNVRDWHKGARPLEFERRAEGIAHGQAKQRPSVPVKAIHDPSGQSSVSALRPLRPLQKAVLTTHRSRMNCVASTPDGTITAIIITSDMGYVGIALLSIGGTPLAQSVAPRFRIEYGVPGNNYYLDTGETAESLLIS